MSDAGNAHLVAAGLRNAASTAALQPPGMLAHCNKGGLFVVQVSVWNALVHHVLC